MRAIAIVLLVLCLTPLSGCAGDGSMASDTSVSASVSTGRDGAAAGGSAAAEGSYYFRIRPADREKVRSELAKGRGVMLRGSTDGSDEMEYWYSVYESKMQTLYRIQGEHAPSTYAVPDERLRPER